MRGKGCWAQAQRCTAGHATNPCSSRPTTQTHTPPPPAPPNVKPSPAQNNQSTRQVPDGVDWAKLVGNAMDTYSLELAGGLGPTAGQIWRVGLLGFNATAANTQLVLDAFKDGLKKQGVKL